MKQTSLLSNEELKTLSEREQEALLKVRQEMADEAAKKEKEAIAKAKQAEEDALLRIPLIEKTAKRHADIHNANADRIEAEIAKAIKEGLVEGEDFFVTRGTEEVECEIWVGDKHVDEGHRRYGKEKVAYERRFVRVTFPYLTYYNSHVLNPDRTDIYDDRIGVEWTEQKRDRWSNSDTPEKLSGRCKCHRVMGDFKRYSLSTIVSRAKGLTKRHRKELDTLYHNAKEMSALIDRLKESCPDLEVSTSYKRYASVELEYPSGSEIHLRDDGSVVEYKSAVPDDSSLSVLHAMFSEQPPRED